MLTDQAIADAATRERPYKLADARSLYVLVAPTGLKSFRWKYRVRGREQLITLGRFPYIGIEEARRRAEAARERVSQGLELSQLDLTAAEFRVDDLKRLADLPQPMIASVVYFVQVVTGHIKIGVTTNLALRLKTLQLAQAEPLMLLGAMPGGHAHERYLHKAFARDRDHGEWFSPSAELLTFIEGLRAAQCH